VIDILPSRRSAIFTDTAARKLPRSFYWGAGIALLLHAGLAYYLVVQTFNPADVPEVSDPPVIGTLYNPPPQQPKPMPEQKPVNHVIAHSTPDPLTPIETTTLTPQPQSDVNTSGPPLIADKPVVQGPPNVTADPGPAYVAARWKAFPDAATLTDYYPPRALDNEIEGSASVQCTVLDAAGHVHCTVVSETPKGYGFGQQTAKMVEEKGRVDTSAGDIKIGSVLTTTTVKWQLN